MSTQLVVLSVLFFVLYAASFFIIFITPKQFKKLAFYRWKTKNMQPDEKRNYTLQAIRVCRVFGVFLLVAGIAAYALLRLKLA